MVSANRIGNPEDDRLFAARVGRYLAGRLDPDDLAALESQLLDSATLRDRFVRLCLVDAVLAEELSEQREAASVETADRAPLHEQESLSAWRFRFPDEPEDADEALPSPPSWPVRRPTARSRPPIWVTVAAAAALVALTCAIVIPMLIRRPPAPIAAATSVILVDTVGAQWLGQAPSHGASLALDAPLELADGLGRLKFARAELIVQGPALFAPVSPTQIRLERGKVWARASATSNFQVVTPGGVVKDLGTEFGVEVDESQRASVHVFEGKVAVSTSNPASAEQVLVQNEAVTFDAIGALQPKTVADPSSFVPAEQFDAVALFQDRSIVVHLTFSNDGNRPAANLLSGSRPGGPRVRMGTDKANSIPDVVPGQLSGTSAVSFNPKGEQRLSIDGGTPDKLDFSRDDTGAVRAVPMTVAAWVRAARDQKASNGACIITRGTPEQYALDILQDRYRFYVHDARGKPYGVTSEAVTDGGWHFVAGTFDPASGLVSLYIDGKLNGTRQGPSGPLPPGRVQGPHDLTSPDEPLRVGARDGWSSDIEYTLDGAIDEIALWRRALSAMEIEDLHRARN
jgi:hypothetical protein